MIEQIQTDFFDFFWDLTLQKLLNVLDIKKGSHLNFVYSFEIKIYHVCLFNFILTLGCHFMN